MSLRTAGQYRVYMNVGYVSQLSFLSASVPMPVKLRWLPCTYSHLCVLIQKKIWRAWPALHFFVSDAAAAIETLLTAQVLTEEQLRRYFSQFGEVLDVYLPKHNSGRNKGFGFTTFETEVQLLAALQVCGPRSVCVSTISVAKRVHKTTRCVQSSEHVIDGVVVRINRAGPRPEYDQSRREEVRQPKFS